MNTKVFCIFKRNLSRLTIFPHNSFQMASLLSYLLIILLSTLLGAFIGYKWFEKQQLKAEEEEDSENDSSDEEYEEEESSDEEDENPGTMMVATELHKDYSMKMVLCVRKDLPMTKGKVCAQCCHAAVGAVSHARRYTKGKDTEISKHPTFQSNHS